MTAQKISIRVPAIALVKMGKIEGTEKLQKFMEMISHDILSEEVRPYAVNSMFLPCVITKMIVQDVPFTEALQNSQQDIHSLVFEHVDEYEMFMYDDEFVGMYSELTNLIKAQQLDSYEEVVKTELSATMDIIIKLSNMGLLSLISKISESEDIKTFLRDNFEIIVKEVFEEAVKKNDAEIYADKEVCSELFRHVYSAIDNMKANVISESVLTTVFIKAINQDVKLSDAVKTFSDDELFAAAIEILKKNYDLSQIKSFMEKVFDIMM